MQKRERGSLTIESTVSLTIFMMVIISIFSFINYCRVQAMISNAVDTTAKEMSQYAYFYEMSGIQKYETNISEQAKPSKQHTNDVLESFYSITDMISGKKEPSGDASSSTVPDSFSTLKNFSENINGNLENIEAEFNKISAVIDKALENPAEFMKSIAALAGETAINTVKSQLIAAPLAKAMVIKHFGGSKEQADKELKSLGVVDGLNGLNFRMSALFAPNAPDDIRLVVYYKVDLISFIDLGLKPAVMCKETRIRAWLGGDSTIEQEKGTEENNSWSIWEMGSMERGKYITAQEVRNLKSNPDMYYASRLGFDAYNSKTNEFIQYSSKDTFSTSYYNNASKLKSALKSDYNKLRNSVSKLDNKVTLENKAGEKQEITINKSKSKLKLVVIVPEDADMSYVNQVIESLKKDVNDDSFVVEVVQGYGKSPNNPAANG